MKSLVVVKTSKVILIISCLHSLINASEDLNIEGKIGINVTKITASNIHYEYDSPKIGAAAGISFIYKIKNKFYMHPEFFLSMKGGIAEDEGENFFYKTSMTLNYIDIPILGVFSPIKEVRIFTGPYIGFFINGKTDYEYSSSGENIDTSNKIESKDINSPDYGLVFGITLSLRKILYLNNYNVGIRYSHGFSNNIQKTVNFHQNNRVIQVIVGWKIGI